MRRCIPTVLICVLLYAEYYKRVCLNIHPFQQFLRYSYSTVRYGSMMRYQIDLWYALICRLRNSNVRVRSHQYDPPPLSRLVVPSPPRLDPAAGKAKPSNGMSRLSLIDSDKLSRSWGTAKPPRRTSLTSRSSSTRARANSQCPFLDERSGWDWFGVFFLYFSVE